jgi:hypothetical protein
MSLLLAAVLGVPIVMALGLFLIMRLGNEEREREGADAPEEQ